MALTPFTLDEVRRILKLSEGQPAPDGRHEGHGGAKHVTLSNAKLNKRLSEGATRHNVAMYTAFLTFEDQVRTAWQVLNSPQAAPELERFYARKNAACTLSDIVLPNSVRVRLATGGERASVVMEASFGTMYLWRDESRPRQLHVTSCFAGIAVMGAD
jgi:hypothetical protein